MGDKTAPVTALAKTEPPPESSLIKSDRPNGFLFTPQTFKEVQDFAKILANSELVPNQYRGKADNVIVALQMGAEVGLAPMQSVQNIAVINGKPSIYGDLGKAILRARGCDINESEVEEVKEKGVAWCIIKRPGQDPVRRTFSIEDAKTAQLWGKSGPWTNYPYRQLGWRAFWFAARDAASDLLKGIAGREEVEDYILDPKTDYKVTEAGFMPRALAEAHPDESMAGPVSDLASYATIIPKPDGPGHSMTNGTDPVGWKQPDGNTHAGNAQSGPATVVSNVIPAPGNETPPAKAETKTANPETKPAASETPKASNGTPPAAKIGMTEQKELFNRCRKFQIPIEDFMRQLRERYNKDKTADLTMTEYNELILWTNTMRPAGS